MSTYASILTGINWTKRHFLKKNQLDNYPHLCMASCTPAAESHTSLSYLHESAGEGEVWANTFSKGDLQPILITSFLFVHSTFSFQEAGPG